MDAIQKNLLEQVAELHDVPEGCLLYTSDAADD